MLAKTPEAHTDLWEKGQKWEGMERWALQVMADPDLAPKDLKVAWVLQFAFNSKTAKCWMTKASIAERAGLSVSSVKQALGLLERNGHITRTKDPESDDELRLIFPAYDPWSPTPDRRLRRGGVAKGVDPRAIAAGKRRTEVQYPPGTDVQSPGGTDVQPPCILEKSWNNPRGGAAGGTTVPPMPEDDFWEDDQLPEKAG